MVQKLGENIYRLRTAKKLSQGELAEYLDVSRQSVSKWENNVSVPDLDRLVKMAELFEVTLDVLVNGDVPKPQEAPASEAAEQPDGADAAETPPEAAVQPPVWPQPVWEEGNGGWSSGQQGAGQSSAGKSPFWKHAAVAAVVLVVACAAMLDIALFSQWRKPAADRETVPIPAASPEPSEFTEDRGDTEYTVVPVPNYGTEVEDSGRPEVFFRPGSEAYVTLEGDRIRFYLDGEPLDEAIGTYEAENSLNRTIGTYEVENGQNIADGTYDPVAGSAEN